MTGRIWVATASGGGVDLLDPRPDQVRLHDLAWGLARIPRFDGQTTSATSYSVARHSCLVEALMPADVGPEERLWALLHDGHEYVLGDMKTPVLRAMRELDARKIRMVGRYDWTSQYDAFGEMALRLDVAVRLALGLPESVPPAWRDDVREADLMALALERRFLMHANVPEGFEWDPLPDTQESAVPSVMEWLGPDSAQADYNAFMAAFRRLQDARHALPTS